MCTHTPDTHTIKSHKDWLVHLFGASEVPLEIFYPLLFYHAWVHMSDIHGV